MTNRREFLHLSVAALSLPIAARAGVSPELFRTEERADVEPLYKVFFDERFSSCTAFADEMKRRAQPTHAIRGDITEAWFSDLYYFWKEGRWKQGSGQQGPAAIAGLTAPGPTFCLEMLARDAGMRVVMRVDHRRDGGRIEHEFAGPENMLARAADVQASGEEWPRRMAELVAESSGERSAAQTAMNWGHAATEGTDPEHLVTWLIAPLQRV
ncbi:MAG: hypothetical protein ACRD4X_17065 [Candidatus Acidiferrales bacterium]